MKFVKRQWAKNETRNHLYYISSLDSKFWWYANCASAILFENVRCYCNSDTHSLSNHLAAYFLAKI